ncbi:hypothetical protein Verru16b_02207 [Lacunisphaera limnophila]|uniref:Uncharacterized protein n=1 Tax=Lacunisphaera limnophila TaxID=1838286 RepID=A0A1D8AW72_9BACT|nr:hypothetical protein [Lacunisphaera limnophila]AOS45131.1 hypothetical protein Verru16b_02207 [Lacunisphaera limnophila]
MKPFLSGKRTHETAPLRSLHLHAASTPVRPANPAPEGPVVEVIKEGDKVVRILVTCACGEKIEVDCLYPVGS